MSIVNFSDLIVGMKVDRSKDSEERRNETRGQQVKRLMDKSKKNQDTTRFNQRKQQIPEKKRRYFLSFKIIKFIECY